MATIKAAQKAEAYIKSQEQFFGFRQPLNPLGQTGIPIPANTRPLRDLGTFGTGEEPEWVTRNRELELTEEGRSQLAAEKALRKIGVQPTTEGTGSKTLEEISEAIEAAAIDPVTGRPKKLKEYSIKVGGKTFKSGGKPTAPRTDETFGAGVLNESVTAEELVDDRSSDEKIQAQLDSPEGSLEEVEEVEQAESSSADSGGTTVSSVEEEGQAEQQQEEVIPAAAAAAAVAEGEEEEQEEELELQFDDS